MPLRTRGAEDGEKSEEEEEEEEAEKEEEAVRRPGQHPSSPSGSLSTLPSWPCMDGDGESRMLLPRG